MLVSSQIRKTPAGTTCVPGRSNQLSAGGMDTTGEGYSGLTAHQCSLVAVEKPLREFVEEHLGCWMSREEGCPPWARQRGPTIRHLV
jgi:hypothetical protein